MEDFVPVLHNMSSKCQIKISCLIYILLKYLSWSNMCLWIFTDLSQIKDSFLTCRSLTSESKAQKRLSLKISEKLVYAPWHVFYNNYFTGYISKCTTTEAQLRLTMKNLKTAKDKLTKVNTLTSAYTSSSRWSFICSGIWLDNPGGPKRECELPCG